MLEEIFCAQQLDTGVEADRSVVHTQYISLARLAQAMNIFCGVEFQGLSFADSNQPQGKPSAPQHHQALQSHGTNAMSLPLSPQPVKRSSCFAAPQAQPLCCLFSIPGTAISTSLCLHHPHPLSFAELLVSLWKQKGRLIGSSLTCSDNCLRTGFSSASAFLSL